MLSIGFLFVPVVEMVLTFVTSLRFITKSKSMEFCFKTCLDVFYTSVLICFLCSKQDGEREKEDQDSKPENEEAGKADVTAD